MPAKPLKKVAKRKASSTVSRAKTLTKASKVAEPENTDEKNHSVGREMSGLFLLAVSLISLISLVSYFVNGGKGENLLGPYLGKEYASFLNLFTGSLPSLFLVVAVALFGFKLLQKKRETFNFKLPLVMSAIYVWVTILLSIKNIEQTQINSLSFSESGGYLGNFIVHQVFIPVFGRTEFGPYLITSILLFFTLILGFKLSLSRVIEKSVELLGVFYYPVRDGWQTLKLKKARKDEHFRNRLLASFNIATITTESSLGGVSASQWVPQSATEELAAPKKRTRRKKSNFGEDEVPTPESLKADNSDLVGILTEAELSDPLEIRKYRDRQAAVRRVSELNEWEVKSQSPTIAGMLSKEKKKKETKKISKEEDFIQQTPVEEPVYPKDDNAFDLNGNLGEGINDIETFETVKREPSISKVNQVKKHITPAVTAAHKVEPDPNIVYDDYKVPSLNDVLEEPPVQELEYSEEFLKEQAKALEEQLANFKVMGKVVGICSGPVIIRYEIELAPGVKVSQIANLSDDLAMALRAKSIRILTPIPGKSAVGIEVPNKKAQIVYIKDILKDPAFEPEEESLKLILGKDIGGEACVMDLSKAPHLLIAGQTGSGKSVCINSFMASILLSKTPDEVRMILVDPKVVELKPYDSIPHLLAPVVTQPEIAVQALNWSTFEMDRRYEVLAKAGVRNIKGFNQKIKAGLLKEKLSEEENKKMPFIVIVIDELADLMMVAGKEVETSIARIAQKARAVGIHLILATQRPSTNVITGTIKANLPTRVAFQVASQIDARTIMDKAGCEKLLGRGDMLFRSIDSPQPERVHGSFLDDDEAEKIAFACSNQNVNYPHIPSFDISGGAGGAAEVEEMPRDVKFRDAAELVVSIRQASVSLLQRRMAIGYARAGRIVDQLEMVGIVGRDRGSKPREVLMDELELASFLSSGLND